jgi:predicted histidine transporter YuiF (NhaC family)
MKLTKAQVKDIAKRFGLTAIEIGIPAFFGTLLLGKITNIDDLKIAIVQAATVTSSMLITALIHISKNLIKAFFNDNKLTKEELESAFDVDIEGGEADE